MLARARCVCDMENGAQTELRPRKSTLDSCHQQPQRTSRQRERSWLCVAQHTHEPHKIRIFPSGKTYAVVVNDISTNVPNLTITHSLTTRHVQRCATALPECSSACNAATNALRVNVPTPSPDVCNDAADMLVTVPAVSSAGAAGCALSPEPAVHSTEP